jgi:outer membrane protein assembly factor BamB
MPNSKNALSQVEVANNGHFTGDFIVLSPKNYIIIPTGTSESISAGGTLDEAVYTYDQYSVKSMTRKPDIDADEFTSMLSETETNLDFMKVISDEDRLIIGDTGGGSGSVEFGASWYDANKAIGGDQDFCTILNGCKFGSGIRAFFTLDYTGTGDGLTFALMNGTDNNASSVGGDIELSELLGYAGDSRIVPNPAAGADYLDSAGVGIQPPKLAVEFDMQTNNDFFDYCVDSNTLRQNTRKDPLSNDRDAIQYVYWGNTVLDINCRADDPSYDDNRHDAEGLDETSPWPAPFATSGDVRSKPAIGPNDTLYVTTLNGHLHAIDLIDGTGKWTFPASEPTVTSIGDVTTNPAINDSGDTVYVTANDGGTRNLWAINTSDGSLKWDFPDSDPAVSTINRTDESSPAVDRNGVVYIGSDVSSSSGKVFAINPDGTQKWVYASAESGEGDVTVDRSSGTYDGTIYVGTDGGEVLAFAPTSAGLPKWSFPTSPDIETGPAVSKDGSIVYILGENGTVYALNAVDGSEAWNSDTSGSYHDNNPVVDTSGSAFDGTIYIMSDEGYLSSVKADGTGFNWEQVPIKDAAAGSPDSSMSSILPCLHPQWVWMEPFMWGPMIIIFMRSTRATVL